MGTSPDDHLFCTVLFTRRATEDFESTRSWYEQRSIDAARKWVEAVEKALGSLERDPDRFQRISDKGEFPMLLQELDFGSGHRLTHRMVFTVRPNKKVVVYAIRHLSQRELSPDDL